MADTSDVCDALEAFDRVASPLFERAFADEAALAATARAWRTWFAACAASPIESPRADRRGNAGVGGLGADYPIETFENVRACWAATARTLAATGGDDFVELARAIDATPAPAFAPTPSRIVLETEGFRLRQLFPREERHGEPVIVLAPLVNRWYVLDLADGASFLATLGQLSRPLYVIEPTLASSASPVGRDDRAFGELCSGPLRALIEHVCEAHGVARAAIAGYSTGGVLATLLAARYPDRVARLATICAPVRFDGDHGGAFARWLSPAYLDTGLVSAAFDRVPAWLVHQPFWWLKPTIKVEKLAQLARRFRSKGYVERFLAVETWSHDNVDFTAGVFRSWVGDLVQKDALAKGGGIVVDREYVTADRVTCPVLVVSGEHDAIVPPRSAEALVDLVASKWTKTLRLASTHVSAVTSQKSLASMVPAFRDWSSS